MGDATASLMIEALAVAEPAPRIVLPPDVFTYEGLRAQAAVSQPYIVDGLIPARSLGMFVGNPGIGKTPLAVQMGMAISAGLPFLGRSTTKGSVLYCIGEGTPEDFVGLQERLARALGLSTIPDEFKIFAPYWSNGDVQATIDGVKRVVTDLRPDFVIVETVRVFAPGMEEKAARVSPMLNESQRVDPGNRLVLGSHSSLAQAES
jgi:RecA-family ATPase